MEKKVAPTINHIIFNVIPNNEKNKKILFINQVENISNNLNTKDITSTLITISNSIKNDRIIIKSHTSYNKIHDSLKLSNKNLTPRSIAIKLARHIKAHYALYSVITHETSNNINLEIQIILVQSGEIIYSNIIPI